ARARVAFAQPGAPRVILPVLAERWPSGRRRWTGIPVTSSRVFVGSNATLSAKTKGSSHREGPFVFSVGCRPTWVRRIGRTAARVLTRASKLRRLAPGLAAALPLLEALQPFMQPS